MNILAQMNQVLSLVMFAAILNLRILPVFRLVLVELAPRQNRALLIEDRLGDTELLKLLHVNIFSHVSNSQLSLAQLFHLKLLLIRHNVD
jgi:hypothetical protein